MCSASRPTSAPLTDLAAAFPAVRRVLISRGRGGRDTVSASAVVLRPVDVSELMQALVA